MRSNTPKFVSVGILATVVAFAWAGEPELKIDETIELKVATTLPTRLTPDGKHVVFIRRMQKSKTHSYWRIGIDGAGARKLFDSSIVWDDLFVGAMGRGTISPDGKRFLAVTTDNGKRVREGGNPRMVICPMVAAQPPNQPVRLPSEKGQVYSAVFTDAETIWYADQSPRGADEPVCLVRVFDIRTGKAKTVFDLGKTMLSGLTLSPDGKRLGGVLAVLGDKPIAAHLWVCDLAKGKWQISAALGLEDYFYDGQPRVFWSADSRRLVANGTQHAVGGRAGKEPFSIILYTPDEKAFANATGGNGEVTWLQRNKNLMVTAAAGPGLVCATEGKAAFLVDTQADTAHKLATPLILLDRHRKTGLFTHPVDRQLHIAPVDGLPDASARERAADGFPTGPNTPEGAACDLIRAFRDSDVALLKRTVLPRYGSGDVGGKYAEFLKMIVTGAEETKQHRTPHPRDPKQIGKVFAARHMTLNGPASYGYAVHGFHDVMFVDIGAFLHDGSRFMNRTMVVQKADGMWYVHPYPMIDPLLSSGLNEEAASTEDFTDKRRVVGSP